MTYNIELSRSDILSLSKTHKPHCICPVCKRRNKPFEGDDLHLYPIRRIYNLEDKTIHYLMCLDNTNFITTITNITLRLVELPRDLRTTPHAVYEPDDIYKGHYNPDLVYKGHYNLGLVQKYTQKIRDMIGDLRLYNDGTVQTGSADPRFTPTTYTLSLYKHDGVYTTKTQNLPRLKLKPLEIAVIYIGRPMDELDVSFFTECEKKKVKPVEWLSATITVRCDFEPPDRKATK